MRGAARSAASIPELSGTWVYPFCCGFDEFQRRLRNVGRGRGGRSCPGNRDRGRPCGLPLPHHRAYGSVHGGSADYANACSRRRGGRRGLELCIGEEASIPASPRRWASPFRLAHRPENTGVLPHGSIEMHVSTLRFHRSGLRLITPPTMPSADFSAAITGLTTRSVRPSRTRRRSPEVRPTAFAARPPDLPPRSLMVVDFAITCSLVRPGRPRIRFLSIGPRFCSTLLSDPASRRRPCASLTLRHHQAG